MYNRVRLIYNSLVPNTKNHAPPHVCLLRALIQYLIINYMNFFKLIYCTSILYFCGYAPFPSWSTNKNSMTRFVYYLFIYLMMYLCNIKLDIINIWFITVQLNSRSYGFNVRYQRRNLCCYCTHSGEIM